MAEDKSKAESGPPPTSGPGMLFRRKRKQPKSYRLLSEELAPYQQKAVLGTAAVVMATAVAGLWGADLRRIFSLESPLLIVGCFVAAAITGLAIGLVILNQGWNSYELKIGKKTMVRKVAHRPDVLIRRSEILRVEEWPGMGLRVLTLSRTKVIHIPAGVHRYNEVKETLSNWRVLEERKGRWPYERWPFATAVAGMAAGVVALIVVIRAEDRAVILPVGILLLAALGWGEYAIQRNPHLDRRIKISAWVGLIGLAPIVDKVLHALRQ